MQVLFPLLDKVAIESGLASTEKSGDSLLIHHSRNTEQKQWSETQASFFTLFKRRWLTSCYSGADNIRGGKSFCHQKKPPPHVG